MRYLILVIDDEREVLDNVIEDLCEFASLFDIEAAESAEEATDIINEYHARNEALALIFCDHIMPGKLGVDFLIELNQDAHTKDAKKILLTGQAGHQDTIKAINDADLDHYIAKPWQPEELKEVTVRFLTDYVLAHDENPQAFSKILDSARIFEHIHEQGDYE